MAKFIIIVMLVLIVASLASAARSLVRKPGEPGHDPRAMARALSWRIGLSVALFILLFVFYKTGLIQPHGLTPRSPG